MFNTCVFHKINYITKEKLIKIGVKEWTKPDTQEKRYYINAENILSMAFEKEIETGMSNKEESVFSENMWYFNESMKLKTSLSFKETKHKYLINSVPALIEKLIG
jgi:hypothetical protein